jgi:hypothetical protein
MVDLKQLKDGELYILTRWVKKPTLRRVNRLAKASLLVSHSTSDLSSQCKELLNVSVPVTLPSRNGIRIEKHSNSNSTQFQRPLRT